MGSDVICCIASGPSLNAADCEMVRRAGIYTIAVNTSWKAARFARCIYASDAAWWNHYGAEIDIQAERWSASQATELQLNCPGGINSGAAAIKLAMYKGAKKVILLGYDCSLANGTHWHPDHVRTKNPDEARVKVWKSQFQKVCDEIRNISVINCSRHTEIDCFERMDLEDAICAL